MGQPDSTVAQPGTGRPGSAARKRPGRPTTGSRMRNR